MQEGHYNEHLHKGASPNIYKKAQKLRTSESEAEKKLWSLLRNRQLNGKKFRRQHPFGNYILDFYCHECRLAIELDGKHHLEIENKEYDKSRSVFLKEYGITVLRFWNHELMSNETEVIQKISLHLKW